MRNRDRKKRAQIIGWSLLVVLSPLLLFGMFKGFEMIDCNTAQNGIELIQRCDTDPRCTLSERELQRYNSYIRLEVARCPSD